VAITPDGGGTTTENLVEGTYAPYTGAAGRYTVVETLNGLPARTKIVDVIDGQTVNLSRDVGYASPGTVDDPFLIGSIQVFQVAAVPTDLLCPGCGNGDIALNKLGAHGVTGTLFQRQAGAWVQLA
jgi:hypothetical protein